MLVVFGECSFFWKSLGPVMRVSRLPVEIEDESLAGFALTGSVMTVLELGCFNGPFRKLMQRSGAATRWIGLLKS